MIIDEEPYPGPQQPNGNRDNKRDKILSMMIEDQLQRISDKTTDFHDAIAKEVARENRAARRAAARIQRIT